MRVSIGMASVWGHRGHQPRGGGGWGIWGAKNNLGLPTLIPSAIQNARRIP
jgi:hypothetical protein